MPGRVRARTGGATISPGAKMSVRCRNLQHNGNLGHAADVAVLPGTGLPSPGCCIGHRPPERISRYAAEKVHDCAEVRSGAQAAPRSLSMSEAIHSAPAHRVPLHAQRSERFGFLPVAKIDGVKPRDKCDKFALSFFATFEQAAARYADLVDRLGDRDRAIERYGDYAGRIELSETDGLSCEPSASGHFDLHESANVDWSNRVQEYLLLGSEA